jgi:hypothetical protein
MTLYLIIFSAGIFLGTMIMGLYVALVNFKDARDDW